MDNSPVFVLSYGDCIIGVAQGSDLARIWLDQNADDDGFIRCGTFICHKGDVSVTETKFLKIRLRTT